jgi:hypothetical protein
VTAEHLSHIYYTLQVQADKVGWDVVHIEIKRNNDDMNELIRN